MNPAVAAVLVGVAGLRPALALVQSRWLAVLVTPLVTGLLATVASMIAVATGTSQFVWWVVLAALANLATLRSRRRWRRTPVDPWIVVASVLVVAAAAYPLIDVGVRNVGWDGRSIWLLHSRWFFAGGDYARVAMQNPVYLFSHPEYPPFVPATVATVWRMSGTMDLWVGQVVIMLLNTSVVALLGLAFVRLVRGRLVVAAGAVGAGVCLVLYLYSDGYAISAYADVLAAAATTAAALYLLVLPSARANATVGLLCGAVAGTTKNEAAPVILGVLVLAAFRHRAAVRAWWPAGVAVVALFAAWVLVTRGIGVQSDLLGGPTSRGAPLAVTHHAMGRAAGSLHKIRSICSGLAAFGLACSLGGLFAARRTRRRLRVGATFWMWGITAVALFVLVGGYVLSPYDLTWHLSTSIDRTTITPRLLLVCEIGVWVICSMAVLIQDRTPSFAAGPPPPRPHAISDDGLDLRGAESRQHRPAGRPAPARRGPAGDGPTPRPQPRDTAPDGTSTG